MESQFRVKRILCHAQYGDILLCDVASGSMTTTTSSSSSSAVADNKPVVASTNATHDRTLAVIKQISWTRVQAKLQQMDAAMQPSDDPMVEIDVAAKICAAGNHKNVVQYHHVLRGDRGSFGIVMEYCNEGDLLKRLDHLPDHRLCESEALLVLHQIVDGLRFLHNDVGVAHRDVSLENVMVHDGICKLGDFGLSTRIHDDNDTDRRRRRLVLGRVGKLSYMAPEVAAGDPYDPALADIWSLGILFFILLTGSPLVEMASTDCPAFRAFCRLGLQRVLEDWKMVDMFHADTISLCDRMLQVDPHNRIPLDRIAAHPAFDRLPTDRP